MNISKIIEVGASDFSQCYSRRFLDSGVPIILFEPNEILCNNLREKLWLEPNVIIYRYAISNNNDGGRFYNYGYASYLQGQKCLANTHMSLDGTIDNYDELLKPLSTIVPTLDVKEFIKMINENTYLSINCNGAGNLILTHLIKLPVIIRMCWYGHNQVQWNIINNNRHLLGVNYEEIVKQRNKLGTFYEVEYIRK